MRMPEPSSPFLCLLSHLSTGISPNAFKKGKKKKTSSLPRWSLPRSLRRQVCRSAALAQRCVLGQQAWEERGRAAEPTPGSCPPPACVLPDVSSRPEIQGPGTVVGSPPSCSRRWFLLKVPKRSPAVKALPPPLPPAAQLSPVVCICVWGN